MTKLLYSLCGVCLLGTLACGKSSDEVFEPTFGRPTTSETPDPPEPEEPEEPTQQPSGPSEAPDGPSPPTSTPCELGGHRCAGRFSSQICYDSGQGALWAPPVACKNGEWCSDKGSCVPLVPECYPEGQLACGAGAALLRCQKSPVGNLVWGELASCPAQGLPYCFADAISDQPACHNECGGNQPIPANHLPGQQGEMACGQWACQPDGSVAHTNEACLPNLHPCKKNAQCISLKCEGPAGQQHCAP